MKATLPAPFWPLPAGPGDCTLAQRHVGQLGLRPGARPLSASLVEVPTQPGARDHKSLRSASQRRLPIVLCSQQGALRSSALGLCRCRSTNSTLAAVRLGLCASEEEGFAGILRSGSKLISACNLMLPLVAACRAALVSCAPSPLASQDNEIECERYERPA